MGCGVGATMVPGVDMALASEDANRQAADEKIAGDNQHGAVNDRLRGGAANTLRASARGHSKIAANGGDDEAEEDGLDQTLQNVGILEELVGHVEVLRGVQP